ncbi:MAG: hypothetical protein KF777_13615 [Planctomycetaceae bacterium]|nr:hypothetical protein [Planctomycetaceae bacterium]
MAEARQRSEWNRTADLMALTANCLLTEGGFTREHFHPFAQLDECQGLSGFAELLPASTLKASK